MRLKVLCILLCLFNNQVFAQAKRYDQDIMSKIKLLLTTKKQTELIIGHKIERGTRDIEIAEKDIQELRKLIVKRSQETPGLSNEDKALIIESVLKQTGEIQKQILKGSAETSLIIKVSDKNIDVKLLPIIPNVNFVLLNTEDIENYEGTILNYLEFEKIEVVDAKVTVIFTWNGLSREFFPTRTGITFEYQKTEGKWVGKWIRAFTEN